jgi:hypothetical protein
MSGPTTAVIEVSGNVIAGATGVAAVVFAARAIKEMHDIHVEYGEAYKNLCERESSRNTQRNQLQQAKRRQIALTHQKAARLESKISRLQGIIAEQLGDAAISPEPLSRPISIDEHAWNSYLNKLEESLKLLEDQLSTCSDTSGKDLAALLVEQPDTNRLLTAYAQQFSQKSKLSTEQQAHYKELSLHLLSRLETIAGEALPIRLESIAREMLQAHDVTRADALASDLRLEIHRINEQLKQQIADTEEASKLLAELADAVPDELRAALEQVAAGVQILDEPTVKLANSLLADVKAARKREEQEAISIVMEQSLRDLGYEVDDISQTLFVSGGVVHFQKQSWQDYHVRMRVSTTDNTVNFNVVRSRSRGDEAQDKRQDYLAEDRWCSEFPALLKTLGARGVKLNVTRLLQAGEVPVQVVDASTLPARKAEEERNFGTAPKQMTMDDKRK